MNRLGRGYLDGLYWVKEIKVYKYEVSTLYVIYLIGGRNFGELNYWWSIENIC